MAVPLKLMDPANISIRIGRRQRGVGAVNKPVERLFSTAHRQCEDRKVFVTPVLILSHISE
jgi:hypothetical protein